MALDLTISPCYKIGLYIVEDVHTAYWLYYDGSLYKESSMIEQFKRLVDHMHLWCVRDPIMMHNPQLLGHEIDKTYYEEWLKFIQFYENIVVFKKEKHQQDALILFDYDE